MEDAIASVYGGTALGAAAYVARADPTSIGCSRHARPLEPDESGEDGSHDHSDYQSSKAVAETRSHAVDETIGDTGLPPAIRGV
jgi:hypothetical protein